MGNKKLSFLFPQTGSKTRGKKKHTSTGVTKADNFNYLAALERAETLHISKQKWKALHAKCWNSIDFSKTKQKVKSVNFQCRSPNCL